MLWCYIVLENFSVTLCYQYVLLSVKICKNNVKQEQLFCVSVFYIQFKCMYKWIDKLSYKNYLFYHTSRKWYLNTNIDCHPRRTSVFVHNIPCIALPINIITRIFIIMISRLRCKPCKKHYISEYLGCVQIHSSPLVTFSELVHNSLTQCSQLCLGTEVATYAAVGPTDCHCYKQLPNFTPLTSECNSTCNGVASQKCGGITGTNTLYNLLRIGNILYSDNIFHSYLY